jgi:diguanylate cyclase (GGDEF)-like protein
LIFDLDKFKRINDTYGHLDGEEFVAVLSNIDKGNALLIAERIRAACEQAIIINKNNQKIQVTTSIGVTMHKIEDALEVTFNRADEFLYQAKSEGRNKVVSN